MTMVDADRASRWAELERLRREGDWQGALSLCSRLHDPLLLWLRPSQDVLRFIGEVTRRLRVHRIVSVGCGSGLFEWLLASATGLQVLGMEVNREWWECRHSPPTFLPLMYPDEEMAEDCKGQTVSVSSALRGDDGTALMFCYFNDMDAFLGYLNAFDGHVLLVVGPGADSSAHCQPQPLSGDIPSNWALVASTAIDDTGDFVAVYTR